MLMIMQDNSVYCYRQRQPMHRTGYKVMYRATHQAKNVRTHRQYNRKKKT